MSSWHLAWQPPPSVHEWVNLTSVVKHFKSCPFAISSSCVFWLLQHNQSEPSPQNLYLLDTLCYYLRCGTQPVNLPLYSVKVQCSCRVYLWSFTFTQMSKVQAGFSIVRRITTSSDMLLCILLFLLKAALISASYQLVIKWRGVLCVHRFWTSFFSSLFS